jgi:hypothetical protein
LHGGTPLGAANAPQQNDVCVQYLNNQQESRMGASGKNAKKKDHRRRHAKSRKIASDKAAAAIAQNSRQSPRR